MKRLSALTKKLLLLLVAAIALTNCGKKPAPQTACGFVRNQDGQRVSWKTQGLVKIFFDKSVPAEMYPSIESALTTWEHTIGHKVFEVSGVIDGGGSPRQDGYSVIYWMNDWDPAKIDREQARTDIYWIGDKLTEADLAFNAKGFHIAANPAPGVVDAQSLILHELGHALGLAHIDDQPSVMAQTLQANFARRELKTVDVQSVGCEY